MTPARRTWWRDALWHVVDVLQAGSLAAHRRGWRRTDDVLHRAWTELAAIAWWEPEDDGADCGGEGPW